MRGIDSSLRPGIFSSTWSRIYGADSGNFDDFFVILIPQSEKNITISYNIAFRELDGMDSGVDCKGLAVTTDQVLLNETQAGRSDKEKGTSNLTTT